MGLGLSDVPLEPWNVLTRDPPVEELCERELLAKWKVRGSGTQARYG